MINKLKPNLKPLEQNNGTLTFSKKLLALAENLGNKMNQLLFFQEEKPDASMLIREEVRSILNKNEVIVSEPEESECLFSALKKIVALEGVEDNNNFSFIFKIFEKGKRNSVFEENLVKNSLSTVFIDVKQLWEKGMLEEENKKIFIDMIDKCYNRGENVSEGAAKLTARLTEAATSDDDLANSKLFRPIASKVDKGRVE